MGVDLDIIGCRFDSDSLDVRQLSATCGAVGGPVRITSKGGYTAHYDDFTLPTFNHLRHHGTDEPVQRMHHYVEHLRPVFIGRICHRGPWVNPGQVGDEYIDFAGLVDQLLGGGGLCQISIVGDNVGTLFAEHFRNRRPHKRGSLGNYNPLTL